MSGDTVGSYRIVGTISAGGMGTVYRAEHVLIGKIAAVKILHPELSSNRDIVNRFFNEAKATTSIKHPGIVEVFDFGYMPSGHAYLIMEFLEGMPLAQRIRKRGPIPEGEAAILLRGVCQALAAAHEKGVVHRDLKPDNVFVIPDPESPHGERTKILDFGIAKLTDLGLSSGGATRTGAVMGTPAYMSPEQCRGTGDVDFRADLYSIGCIFYELVTGRPPFLQAGAGELIASHLFIAPESPARFATLTAETEALIMTLLAKQPADRVQSAALLAHHLAVIAQQHGWIAPGDLGRPPRVDVPAGPGQATKVLPTGPGLPTPTPMFSARPTPALPHAPIPTPAPPFAPKPTTLSGAASQVGQRRRSHKSLGIALAAIVVVGGAVFALVARSGGLVMPAVAPAPPPDSPAKPGVVAAPRPSTPQVPAPVAPSLSAQTPPAPTQIAQPAVPAAVPPPAAVTPPAAVVAEPVAPPPPAAVPPASPTQVVETPAVPAPTRPAAKHHGDPAVTPHATTPPPSATKSPAKSKKQTSKDSDKPATESQSKDMLEQDI